MAAEMRLRSAGPGWAALALAVAVIFVVALFTDLRALAQGVLAAWLFCLSLSVGATAWLLIVALTGGRWLARAQPVLAGLSRLTWLAALAGLILLPATGPLLFPWWQGAAEPALWFGLPFFAARGIAILSLWSILGVAAARGLPPLAAALALVAHAVAVSVAGLDWVLSLDPGFVSTAFGAHFAVLQLALALAVVAATGSGDGDIGGLLIACVLGVFYLGAMEYVVSWTGNLPHKAAWYLARQGGRGLALLWLSFVLGVAGPFAVLLITRLRRSARYLRWVGGTMLAGGLAHLVWLVAPGGVASAAAVALAGAGAAAALFYMIGVRAHAR